MVSIRKRCEQIQLKCYKRVKSFLERMKGKSAQKKEEGWRKTASLEKIGG
jgi:hypothetical protein